MKIKVDWDEDMTEFLEEVRQGKHPNLHTLEDQAFYKTLNELVEIDSEDYE